MQLSIRVLKYSDSQPGKHEIMYKYVTSVYYVHIMMQAKPLSHFPEHLRICENTYTPSIFKNLNFDATKQIKEDYNKTCEKSRPKNNKQI